MRNRVDFPVDLSVIIVTWNVCDLLTSCLRSLEAISRPLLADAQCRHFGPAISPTTLEVIVVDSASSDATPLQIPQLFPWVRYLRAESNLGFTRGNNLGYAASRGHFVYFLNPDTELRDGETERASSIVNRQSSIANSLWTLFCALNEDDALGMVGPQLRYGDGSFQNSRRRFPTRLTGFFESTWLAQVWSRNPWAQAMHIADVAATEAHNVDWLTGAAMFARRSALEQVRMREYAGPFDEAFFMYSEETDLCHRLRDAGWRIRYVPAAVVTHHEAKSSEQATAQRQIHFNSSKVRYARKYFGAGWAAVLRQYILLEFRSQRWLEQLKYWLGHKRNLRAARIAAYQQVIASGLR